MVASEFSGKIDDTDHLLQMHFALQVEVNFGLGGSLEIPPPNSYLLVVFETLYSQEVGGKNNFPKSDIGNQTSALLYPVPD